MSLNADTLTRAEKLRLIYRWTHSDFKGRIDGEPSILVLRGSTTLVMLKDLTDAEIADKLPYALKKEAERKAKAAAAA